MGKIKGWIKVQDNKRGSVWLNKDKKLEVGSRFQVSRNVWRVNVNNSKGGNVIGAPSYFDEYKNRVDAEKVIVAYMKHISGTSIPNIKKDTTIIATVRVMPLDEDNEDDSNNAMQFEYTNGDYEFFRLWLKKNKAIKSNWEVNGNAYSMEGKKSVILAFQKEIQKRYTQKNFSAFKGRYASPFKGKIGIEWNYWVE